MITRMLLNAKALKKPLMQSQQLMVMRQVHKGVTAAPPMRWFSIPEKLATYLFVCFAFLSYPTYVLYNLDNMRPRPDNELSPETQAALEEHREARLAGLKK
ncbi:hypothetical protein M3Y97_00702800 [Aphelenchoides bicaudatus]|nr:hypothetical protein M3Y97_00702800 [Aphelenchoides bicaudatus]